MVEGEAAVGATRDDEVAPDAKRWRFVGPPEAMRRTLWLTPMQNERENGQRRWLVTMKRRPFRSDVEGMLREMSTRCPRIHDEVAGLY